MIRILLVDDHPAIGQGTKVMIEQEPDLQVTAVCSGMEALDLLTTQSFELMVCDLNMPVISGLELTRRVTALYSDMPVLIYTGYDLTPNFNPLVEAGISGLVSKTASREQLITSIRCALRGDAVLPISLFQQLRRQEVRLARNGIDSSEDVSFSEQEQLILREISHGKSNRELAQQLLMSQRAVEYKLTCIFKKLNVRSRAEALAAAKRLRLIPSDELL